MKCITNMFHRTHSNNYLVNFQPYRGSIGFSSPDLCWYKIRRSLNTRLDSGQSSGQGDRDEDMIMIFRPRHTCNYWFLGLNLNIKPVIG